MRLATPLAWLVAHSFGSGSWAGAPVPEALEQCTSPLRQANASDSPPTANAVDGLSCSGRQLKVCTLSFRLPSACFSKMVVAVPAQGWSFPA